MPRDLRLRATQDLNKIANTNLLFAEEIQYPKPAAISECLKDRSTLKGRFAAIHLHMP